MTPTQPKPVTRASIFAVHREDWLTAHVAELTAAERQRKEAAKGARKEVQRALTLLCDADALLGAGGTASGRIRITEAVERLAVALRHLPEGL